MASKRKLEEDADALSPPSKSAKVSDEVTRSGRVRKKPARFQDTEEEFDEDGGPIVPLPTGAAEMAKTTEPSKPKSGQKLQTTVVNIPEVAVIESPKVAKVITTPKMVTAAKKMPQKTTGVDAGVPTPQIIPQPARVVPVARVVSPTSQQESAEQTKTGRVRKKSTKVLEMEAFEEAERTKTTKKAAGEVPQRNQKSPTVKKVGQTSDKPASTIPAELSPTGQLPVSLFADKPPVKVEPAEQLLDTSIPPQALSAPAIQGKINPALVNLPPFPPSKLGTPASKKAKKKKDDPKLLPDTLSGIPPMPPSAMATSVSSKKATKAKPRKSVEVMEVDLSSVSTSMPVKEEPLEGSGVRGQPTQVLNPSVLSAVANTVRVKREPASPSKTQKKLMIAVQDETDPLLAETGIHVPPKSAATAVVGGGGSKSVIKMLLNTPTQFSKPSVSTQSINSEKSAKSAPLLFQNRSPPSDSDLLIDASFVKNESTEISGSNLSLKLKNVTVPDQLSTATHTVSESILLGDQGHSSMDDDSFEKKKPGKRVPLRKSISIEQLDDDDDDDEDDDDDDDFDNPDDSGEWEFENQDGKLVIADFATKGLEMDEDIGQMESEEKSKSKKSRTKPKTVPRKKTAKSKSDMPDNEDGKKQGKQTKEKTKKRLTAYTMWCNTVRTKVLNENRGMDFANLSRRLGEIWQGLPAKEKMAWKRKAKREARKLLGKGLLISTSKGGGGVIHTSIPSASAVSAAAAAAASASAAQSQQPQATTIHHTQPVHHMQQSVKLTTQKSVEDHGTVVSSKAFGFEPIDVAAHLKLVGESLSIIGTRLQEHRGLIAVQGSLSVLLDSMLCAFGPLMCLTACFPEMNGCSAETHVKTLDNIAYFMPGL